MTFKDQTMTVNTGHSDVTITFTWISPSEAKEMLRCNTRNRAVRPTLLNSLTRAIKQDNWHFTGDTIKLAIDSHGNEYLADAQHRLGAIANGDRSVPVIIVRGLTEESTALIDQAATRSAKDITRMSHRREDPHNNGNAIQAIARCYLLVENKDRSDRTVVAAFMDDTWEELDKWATWAKQVNSLCPKVKPELRRPAVSTMKTSALGALGMWMCHEGADEAMVRIFFMDLAEGTPSPTDDSNVIETIRRRWQTYQLTSEGSGPSIRAEFDVYVRAFNRWIKNEPLQMAKARQPLMRAENITKPYSE